MRGYSGPIYGGGGANTRAYDAIATKEIDDAILKPWYLTVIFLISVPAAQMQVKTRYCHLAAFQQ